MPTLPAAGYAVPNAPSVEPASTANTPYQNSAAATPEAFGGYTGAALNRLSSQADAASDSTVSIQNTFNQYAAQGASNAVGDKINAALYGDPDTGQPGFNALRGKNALDAWPVARKQLDQIIQQQRATLQNPAQQLRFDQETRRLRDWALSTAGRHFDTEYDRWQTDTAAATQKLNLARIGSAAADTDLAAWNASTAKAISDAERDGQLRGLPPEAVEAQKLGIRQHAVESFADGQAAAGNPFGALKLVQQNAATIGADRAEALTQRYRAAAKAQQIDNLANGRPVEAVPSDGLVRGGAPMVRGGAVQSIISQAAQQAGVSDRLALTTASIESSMGQNLGSRGNIFQLGQPEWAASGGGQMGDPATDIRNGITFLAKTKTELSAALGYEPSDAQVYLGHQQGVGGAVKLLTNPNTPAGQLVPAQNIRANGGDPNAPASAFVAKWTRTFDSKASQFGGPGTLASSQLAPESGGDFSGGAPASAPAAPIVAVGDSLAAHVIRKAGAGGQESGKVGVYNPGDTAVSGYDPSKVLDVIRGIPDAQVQGKNVVLSTGTSNDPEGKLTSIIPAQIALLRSKGAANVVVMGVGPKFADRNQQLAQIAQEAGVPFAGALQSPAGDGIHSSDQNAQLAAARNVLPATGITSAQTQQNPALRPDSQVPGLQAKIDEINRRADAEGVPDDIRAGAIAQKRQQMNNAHTDETWARQEAAREKAETEEAAKKEWLQNMYSDHPTATAQQIANDPRLSASASNGLIGVLRTKAEKSPVDPGVSATTTHNLFGDIVNGRVTNLDPLTDAFNKGQLNDEDYIFLSKQLDDVKTPEGLKLSKDVDNLFTAAKASITKSNPLMGKNDESGDLQFGAFQEDVRNAVAQMRKEGKSVAEISQYLSIKRYRDDPTLLQPYKTSASQSMANMKSQLSPPPPPPAGTGTVTKPNPLNAPATSATGAREFTAPIPPRVVLPAQPGESIDDYERRTRGGASSK